METRGVLAPTTEAEARAFLDRFMPIAKTVVRDVAKAMDFDSDEYDTRVTGEVVETARDAIFASLLEVTIGTREEFDDWQTTHDYDVIEVGSANVNNIAWHAVPFTETVIAATFQDKQAAAVDTLRRQAYGRVYRELAD